MTCVSNGNAMLPETRYVLGGKYTMAFLVVEPLHFSPQRVPSFVARLMAAVSSFELSPSCPSRQLRQWLQD